MRRQSASTTRHRLFNLAAAGSLVLCVLLCALWVRSYLTFDSYLRVGYVPAGGNSATWWEYGVDSIRGTVTVRGHRQPTDLATARSSLDGAKARGALGFGTLDPQQITPRIGFRTGRHIPALQIRSWSLVVPTWSLAALAALLPATKAFRVVYRRRRERRAASRGVCHVCGYDLRASPERCPECGNTPPATTAAAQPANAPDRAGRIVSVGRVPLDAGPAGDRPYVMVPWRVIFFAVNVAACVGWIVLTAQFIGESGLGLFAFLIGAIMAAPAVAVGIAEWLLFMRRVTRLERPLGVLGGLVGALSLFGFVANAGEAAMKGGSPGVLFWLGFGASVSQLPRTVFGAAGCASIAGRFRSNAVFPSAERRHPNPPPEWTGPAERSSCFVSVVGAGPALQRRSGCPARRVVLRCTSGNAAISWNWTVFWPSSCASRAIQASPRIMSPYGSVIHDANASRRAAPVAGSPKYGRYRRSTWSQQHRRFRSTDSGAARRAG
jgi:hypothetical protein